MANYETRGLLDTREESTKQAHLKDWEELVVESVGHSIEFWGFKRNHGRVWALLYVRNRSMTAAELQLALKMSKGAVSMIVRELEQWGVILRVRQGQETAWRFVAETNLMDMVARVLKERELKVVQRVREDLKRAQAMASEDETEINSDVVDRVQVLEKMAGSMQTALQVFLKTLNLDVKRVFSIFTSDKQTRL